MPEISRFYGIVVYMFFDDHNPPNIHVEYSGHQASINIQTGLVKGELPKRALKLVFEWMEQNEQRLLENWELAVQGNPLNKISPLD